MTGRIGTAYSGKFYSAVQFQTVGGTPSSTVAIPDFAGNFYFVNVPDGQLQLVLDPALALKFPGTYNSQPQPDVPIPSGTPTPKAYPSASSGAIIAYPSLAPYHDLYRSYSGPYGLLVTDPVTSPVTDKTKPKVEVDLSLYPFLTSSKIFQTSTERFANFFVGFGPPLGPPGTSPDRLKVEAQVLIYDASGSAIVAATATSSVSPIYRNFKNASGSVVPSGNYAAKLRFWKAGGSFGGADFYGESTVQPLTF